MAKVFSPSGETEFFQITELQSAFEKELKTGEKVTVIPGAKEASFLREAPVRADWTIPFQQFKERVLNPVNPIQPPVTRYVCTAVVRQMILQILGAHVGTGAYYSATPYLGFTTTLDISAGLFPVPQCNTEFGGVPDGLGGYDFQPLPFQNNINKSSPSAVEIIVPNYYTLTAYLLDWTPDDPPNGQIDFSGINITNGLGGGTDFSTGAFSCIGMPAEDYVPSIFQLKADLYVPKYGGPFNYGVVSNCSYTLFNYSFTNFYP